MARDRIGSWFLIASALTIFMGLFLLDYPELVGILLVITIAIIEAFAGIIILLWDEEEEELDINTSSVVVPLIILVLFLVGSGGQPFTLVFGIVFSLFIFLIMNFINNFRS